MDWEVWQKKLGFIRERKVSYLAFKRIAGVPFLKDMAVFCRANETCVVKDENGKIDTDRTLILEGRREVWLRIQNHFNLTPEQLLAIYDGRSFTPKEEENG